jgi:uncharacterized protein YecE (DUF72 family)
MTGRLFIGTSGYVYQHWRRRFYPAGLAAREWLPFYARSFDTVELNNPFYRLPERATFAAWRRTVPAGFVFAVKASRYLTHIKRLRAPAEPLARFLRRARALGPTLGPLLFQLPESFHLDLDRLERFLRALARQRARGPVRAVLEVRHASWLEPRALDRLRESDVALCLTDWRATPVAGPLTASFVYVRRHGPLHRYRGRYPDATLDADATSIRGWQREGRDVYVYFNNDVGGHAVRDAIRLLARLPGASAAVARDSREAVQSR